MTGQREYSSHRECQPATGSRPEGVVFEIQRWSVDDGPGIRTVVFLKGCPLRCRWCCNPESWSPAPQVALFEERCRDCGVCREACPLGIAGPAGSQGFDSLPGCTACGRCVSACPAGAREIMGRRMTAGEVLAIVERDRVFYRRSGGGVTFSGGEALAQAPFLRELVQGCRAAGLSMALETSGYFPWAENQDILEAMNLVFLDIKHMAAAVHRRVTGVDNRIILENAVHLAQAQIPLVIRLPLIPTINDSAENIRATAAFVAGSLPGALGVEVLPYHTLGRGKFKSIGLQYPLAGLEPPGAAAVAAARQILADLGIPPLSNY